MKRLWPILVLLGLAGRLSADTAPSAHKQPSEPDDLYGLGQQLFDAYAPPEVKDAYQFPTKEQWDDFAARLDRALKGNSLDDLATLAPEARDALAALRALPGYEAYADWLEQRIDEMDAAGQVLSRRPAPTAPRQGASHIPHYEVWEARMRSRPVPADAAALMPGLKGAFAAEGVPPEMAWIAEAESTLNPDARSPAGAVGLFQLMPETARMEGLSTFLPDERSNPDKSAHAAAKLLRALYARFSTWPLAIAAYNAGEGRVRRALESSGTGDFAGAEALLPAQTRMYVPKVCALVEARTGTNPEHLPAPRL